MSFNGFSGVNREAMSKRENKMNEIKLLAVGVKRGKWKNRIVCCVVWFEETLETTMKKAEKMLGVKPEWVGVCLPLTLEGMESLKKKLFLSQSP